MNFYEELQKYKKTLPELYEIITNNLINVKGRIEGQRITEKYFKKHNLDFSFFEKNKIKSAQALYNFITKETSKCSFNDCDNERRWVGMRVGYKPYCEICSRSRNNWISNVEEKYKIDLELNEIYDFVKDSNGNFNTSKLKKLSERTLNELVAATNFIQWDASSSERLYCYLNNITSLNDLPKCEICSDPVTMFYSGVSGYLSIHKGKCARKNQIILLEKAKDTRNPKIRKARSSTIFKRMEEIPEGYERLRDFDAENYYQTGTDFITLKCDKGHTYNIDNHYQGSFKCESCFPSRSRQQTDLYDLLKEYDSNLEQNNRRIIPPKEIDIVSEKYKFGIEYNSQSFHSSGYSTYRPLNKTMERDYHLDKTTQTENNGYHLYHIFSSEYLNDQKLNIWLSMIKNKMNHSQKIYARKCKIKEISSKEARQFCKSNHIQGYVNSSVCIGLYYQEELVQLQTFGKPRQNKYKGDGNYELLRMCSKLNTSVVGGASKLLNYFERKYNPRLILSYANRRWSNKNNNIYKKLNFELLGETKPNYFYFDGKDDSKLESRIKYQKHKLRDLEGYKEELTETEIMLDSGYRKIYDSGNLIYVKKY